MKLQRKENALTLKQLRFSSKVDRMQKKVDKRQKYYDKLKKQIERQANCYKNSMNMQISNMFGLGTNGVNLNNPYGTAGAAQIFLKNLTADGVSQILGNNAKISDEALNAIKNGYQVAGQEIASGTKLADGKAISKAIPKGALFNPYDSSANIIEGDYQAIYSQLQSAAQYQVSNMQTQASNMKSAYENNVSIWMEAQLEQLEAQEEWEMDLLAEEQADMEAEKNTVEVQLQRVQEEKKNIEQALGQAIQDSAPKFGLA